MAATIDVVFRYQGGRSEIERRFTDFREAVRFALRSAHRLGRAAAIAPPREVHVVDGDTMILALRVFFGGLNPADVPRSPARSPLRRLMPTAIAALRR